MRIQLPLLIAGIVFMHSPASSGEAAPATDIESLRAEILALRNEYESRIRELETRVAVAEQQANRAATRPPAEPAPMEAATAPPANRSGGMFSNAFNPAIALIFQGQAWGYARNPDDYRIPGFVLGGEAGPVAEGLAIGESELDINANVDDKFTAWLTIPFVIEDGDAGVEIEEAWVETLALPAGLAARFGRFFSGIGYLNNRHAHVWDFLDQPLPYQAFLGDQYLDDGVQIRWLAPTDLYLEFGGEILRGSRYPAGGDEDSGFGTRALYVHTGGDVGDSHSWLAGISWLHAESGDRESGAEDNPLLFNGDTDLAVAQFVWKWSPLGNWRQRNLIVQGEYLWRNEDGRYTLLDGSAPHYRTDQAGWYLQAVYQPFPQWRFGARFDTLSTDNPGPLFAGTDLEPGNDEPRRFSLMLDWSNSEFSRLRLQYTYDDAALSSGSQWGLQYIHSIGAHGAHTF